MIPVTPVAQADQNLFFVCNHSAPLRQHKGVLQRFKNLGRIDRAKDEVIDSKIEPVPRKLPLILSES